MKMTWILIASALALLEVSTANLVCIWFIGGAIGGFIASYFTDSAVVQFAVFAAVSGIVLFATRPLAKKINSNVKHRTNSDALIGRKAVVTEKISPDSKGRVVIDNLSWLAQSDTDFAVGDRVEITRIKGVTLVVKAAE